MRSIPPRMLPLVLAAGLAGRAQETPRPNRVAWLEILPEPLPSGARGLSLEATSQFLRPDRERSADGRGFARLDGEEWQLTGDWAWDLGPGRLCLRARLVDRSGGIADQLLVNWHKLLGVTHGGRLEVPKHRLVYHMEYDGTVVAHLDRAGLHLMDLDVAWVQERGSRDRGWRWGVALQLPNGKQEDFTGSGGWDALVGAAAWTRQGIWTFHAQAERLAIGLPGQSPYRAVMQRRALSRAWAGAGVQGGGSTFWRGFGLDVTLAYSGSPYHLGLTRVDRAGWQQHWTVSHAWWPRWRFSFAEEAGTYTCPDISAALEYRF